MNWRNATDLTWEGRELQGITLSGADWLTYTYNSSGIRTQKVYFNNIESTFTTHSYTLDGSSIIRESVTGPTAYTLDYLYDSSGRVQGFIYNNKYYYFQKNLQGDVIRILNSNGTVVTEYTYDAWGNVLTITGSLASTVGRYNPFRYRGYYYDEETGFYYLQSRYYDPTVGRFLNADKYASTGIGILGCNMFAYCNNNPISYIDINGSEPASATAGAALGAAGVVLTIFVVVAFFDYEVATDFVAGAIDLVESLVDTVVGAFSSTSSSTAAQTLTGSVASIDTNKEEAKSVIESVLTEKLTNYEGPIKTPHLHHIVAQNEPKASTAREILNRLLPGGVNNVLNLVYVKAPVHQRLHTNVYYGFVNMVICEAYESAGLNKEEQTEKVIEALKSLRNFINSLNEICPD